MPPTPAPAKPPLTPLARCARHAKCCATSCATSLFVPCCHFSSQAAMGCQEDDEPTHSGSRCFCFDESAACWVSILLFPTLLPQACALIEHTYIYCKYGEIGVLDDDDIRLGTKTTAYNKRFCTACSCPQFTGGSSQTRVFRNPDGTPVATVAATPGWIARMDRT